MPILVFEYNCPRRTWKQYTRIFRWGQTTIFPFFTECY